jgi:hypothetical protein
MKTHPRVNLEVSTDYRICPMERFIFNNLSKELMTYVYAIDMSPKTDSSS